MGMFDWLNTKAELDSKTTSPQRTALGEPVIKLLKSLKEDDWVCDMDDDYGYHWKSICKKDNQQVSFRLVKHRTYTTRVSEEELSGYDWMTSVERAAVHNAVNEVFNANYSKQVNERKEEQRVAFAAKLDDVAPILDIGEPVLSLLKAMEDATLWRFAQEVVPEFLGGMSQKVFLQHKQHADVSFWLNDTSSVFYSELTWMNDDERKAFDGKIGKLIEAIKLEETRQENLKVREKFMVLVNKEKVDEGSK